MKKQTLIKYIHGLTSQEEDKEVREWAMKNKANEAYLATLMNISATFDREDDRISDAEYSIFMQKAKKHKRIKALLTIVKYAAVILLFVSIATNIFLLSDNKNENSELLAVNQLGADSLIQEIYVVKGAKSKVELPDGSIVWLNSDSKITFPLKFDKRSRNVYLSGEAFFDVVHNEKWPMIVSVKNNIFVEILGTQFNLRSYDNEELQATLYSGKINILAGNPNDSVVKTICEMKPNETYIAATNDGIVEDEVKKVSKDAMDKISAWKEGYLYFSETPMEDVIKQLERWHGVEFIVKDSAVLNYTITAKFDNESAIQIMEMMKLCAPIDYVAKENVITLSLK